MGTRTRSIVIFWKNLDHPHAYGDKGTKIAEMTADQGSSPRVWGQVFISLLRQRYVGIIPTRMGTSALCPCSGVFAEDHPHAYGDKRLSVCAFQNGVGSSPRVWGQASFLLYLHKLQRIIPTRMGTSVPDDNAIFAD